MKTLSLTLNDAEAAVVAGLLRLVYQAAMQGAATTNEVRMALDVMDRLAEARKTIEVKSEN